MNLISISSFQDNYIWILIDKNNNCVIVDPGESKKVINIIKNNNFNPIAILITHYHYDHVDGVSDIKTHFPNIIVLGPKEALNKGITRVVNDGEIINVNSWDFFIISVPGHTLGHVAFYNKPYLFCGDTIFSGGCGKIFEGTSIQMYNSLQKINSLPEETLICCAHEYTLENMIFALSILPEDKNMQYYYCKVNSLRSNQQKTLPVTLKNERQINLFLRLEDNKLIKKINEEMLFKRPEQIFQYLRFKKDKFRI